MKEKNSVFGLISEFLREENIEIFAALPFEECEIINERRLPDFEAKSAVVFLIPYYTAPFPDRNVSLYSVSRDYHLFAERLSEKLKIRFEAENFSFRLYADASCVNERKLALKAGIGVLGKNHLLINELYGSYVFIGEILTDAVFLPREYANPVDIRRCVSCGACGRACEFLREQRGECRSALNQKKRLSEEELAIVRSQKIRWGCDVCQEVCPMNRDVKRTPISFFYEEQIPFLTKKALAEMSDEEFKSRAYSWRGRGVMERNLDD